MDKRARAIAEAERLLSTYRQQRVPQAVIVGVQRRLDNLRSGTPTPPPGEHSQSETVKLRRGIADIIRRGDGTRMNDVLKALEAKLAALL